MKVKDMEIRLTKDFRLIYRLITIIILLLCTILLFFSKSSIKSRCIIKKTPNILYFNPPTVHTWVPSFVKRKYIICPLSESKTVVCNIHYRWEQHPNNIDAYLFDGYITLDQLPIYRNPQKLWVLMYEESPRQNPIVMSEKLLTLFNFSATFSRHSDVPFPLQHFYSYAVSKFHNQFKKKKSIAALSLDDITNEEFYVNTSMKNSYLKEIAPILYIESNQYTFNDRDKYVLKLMEYISIDSLGKSINRGKLPKEISNKYGEDHLQTITTKKFLDYTARYKFMIAIENAVCEDYITEKLWRPIEQGVVPIYFGSPSVRDWLPNKKSAILIEDFATPKHLADYLHVLMNNDTKYEEHLEHKTKKIITNQKLINEFKARPYQMSAIHNFKKLECFTCSRLHETKSDTINTVSRNALDCKMPSSLLSHTPDPENNYTFIINEYSKAIEVLHDKYSKGIPLEVPIRNPHFPRLQKLLSVFNKSMT